MLNLSWYPIPPKIVDQQLRDGIKEPITEVALRPITGEDSERALDALRNPLQLKRKLVERSFCGLSRDKDRKEGGRVMLSRAASDPDLLPENVLKAAHIKVVALIELGFSDLCDGDEEDVTYFRKGRSVRAE